MISIIKRRKITTTILALLIIITLSYKLKPRITIKNNTNEIVRVYVMERVISEDEPSIEEVDQLKKVRILNPQEKISIAPSFSTLLHINKEIDIGWRTMPPEKINTKVGHKWFFIKATKGNCSYSLTISNDNYALKNEHSHICIKRLTPITD
jgi:hypothetical protein